MRTASALVLGPVVLALLWAGGAWLALLMALISWQCLREYAVLVDDKRPPVDSQITLAAGLLLIGAAHFFGLPGAITVFVAAGMAGLVPWLFRGPNQEGAVLSNALGIHGLFHHGLLLSFVVLLRAEEGSPRCVLALVALIWAQDVVAYFAGTLFGRRKLHPYISGGKSWEGTLAGLLAGPSAAWFVLAWYAPPSQTETTLVCLTGVALMGQLGDLSESQLKRNFKAKDSGTVIPGHGGLLDRFDSLSYAAPAMYLVHRWL